MPKITTAQKAQILSEVKRKATDKFHGVMQQHDAESAEATLEQELENL